MDALKIGLIGCGGMGMKLAQQCHLLENAKITAVCDAYPQALSKAAEEFGAAKHTTYRKLLASDVDGVIIATPNDMHARITIEAANLGKHVFCEKPMAMKLSDCRAMVAATDKAGVKLMVGQVLRLMHSFWKTHEIATSGALGEPFAMNVVRLGGLDRIESGWRGTRKHAGGVLFEIHVHELDFMRHVLGEAESVFASVSHFTPSPVEYEDTAFVQVRHKNGRIGTLHCGVSSSMDKHEMMVQCTNGTVTNEGFGGAIRYSRFGDEPTVLPVSEIEKENAHHEELRSWVDAITKGTPMVFDGRDGMAVVEIVEAAYRSARTGRVVKLPLK